MYLFCYWYLGSPLFHLCPPFFFLLVYYFYILFIFVDHYMAGLSLLVAPEFPYMLSPVIFRLGLCLPILVISIYLDSEVFVIVLGSGVTRGWLLGL